MDQQQVIERGHIRGLSSILINVTLCLGFSCGFAFFFFFFPGLSVVFPRTAWGIQRALSPFDLASHMPSC